MRIFTDQLPVETMMKNQFPSLPWQISIAIGLNRREIALDHLDRAPHISIKKIA